MMGGTDVVAIQDILRSSEPRLLPFAGHPRGHPTKLAGTPQDIEAHCRDFAAKGCAGADAFTVGSAALDGSHAPGMGSVLSQLSAIQADLESVR
jgi:hypothetical protein